MKRAIFVAPFGELSEPRVVAELARRTEERGWDGFFVWDHVAYKPPVRELADPWVCLSAVAMVTSRVLIGPLITPLPRRRMHQLARETVSVDRLSGGRLVLGVGIGSETTGEFDPARFGEEGDMRERARLLDDGLERLVRYWDGEFEPRPVHGRIPIWVGGRWPRKKPLARAAKWQGYFPVETRSPDDVREMAVALGEGFPIIVVNQPDVDPAPWFQAGATWVLTGFGPEPTVAAVEAVIDAGP
ncbi:LLM class flavin-dependent oxidoreductase [Solirubrobacter sp. CPCC 204708]|uniref:LLM class flavin-dependent oxidoreductase n=1 Tax=Solirubrobacter deserti TaxID=2282478 RepID=A0ABT4RNN4_9ACTN|nr:LLM class flavin-dependent oxidoreductase [Solirubrobacter deserti]MBE2314923.1 LLM class flavin-dependent oxidoreductase [Solirubrobacter deserti]MDA0140154.1 LLM class flavin-dependent oxidoreductase [Solirubrobacter deserti]